MAKKFSKLVLFSALAGAAAAGTYYYLRNKANAPEDDIDDFDDFEEDFSADSPSATGSKNHPHVPIDIDNAKEIIGEKVIETLDKTKEKLEHFNVSEKIDKAKEIIGEMTSPAVEPVYTQVDMSSVPAQDEITSSAHEENTSSVSATYADSGQSVSTTVKFFDDSESEP